MAKGEKTMNIFEQASRKKIRFQFLGTITTEDLWDLSLTALDELYKEINNNLKNQDSEGLFKDETISEESEFFQLQADLVRHVFEAKLAAKNAAKEELVRKEKKKRIMEIISSKQDQELSEKSIDELWKMLDEM